MKLFKFFVNLFLFAPLLANADTCELPKPQVLELWPFELVIDGHELSWSAEEAAVSLKRKQIKYFNEKDSPFAKKGIKAELGFYEPGIKISIDPKIIYTKTLNGKDCAMTNGVVMHVKHSGEIQLAKELTIRSCVSIQAMNFQKKNHDIAVTIIDSMKSKEGLETIKKIVFDVFQVQGAAGATPQALHNSIKYQQSQATGSVANLLLSKLSTARRITTQTKQNISALLNSCNGDFADASERTK